MIMISNKLVNHLLPKTKENKSNYRPKKIRKISSPMKVGEVNISARGELIANVKSQKGETSKNGPQKSDRSLNQEFWVFYVSN